MPQNRKFTVFTPIYNRKHTVTRVWESLQKQTYRNFEWVVIDDGSTDGVWDLLKKWEKEADFPVICLQQENKGKHVAWNRAVKIAQGELFVPADSDDSFEAETLERFAYHWKNSIPQQDKNNYSGINVLCKDPYTGKIVGTKYPEDMLVSNNLDLHYVHHVTGEHWGAIRTDILRTRPFKEIKGTYLSEKWIWFHIARKYKVLCVNEALRNFYTDNEVSLTNPKSNDILRAAKSRYTLISWNFNANMDYILKYESIIDIAKRFINLWRYAFLSNTSKKNTISELSNIKIKIASLIFLLPGYMYYLLTLRKIKSSKSE